MKRWVVKAAAQSAMSVLPQPQRWNRLFQEHVTKSLAFTDTYFLGKWLHCSQHADTLARLRQDGRRTEVLELGTGWYPVVPVGLALTGADAVWSVDRNDLMTPETVLATLQRYVDLIDRGEVTGLQPERVALLRDLVAAPPAGGVAALLRPLGVRSLVGDARSLPLPASSVRLFTSNNTLEHIPGPVIAAIFTEFRRLASADATMSHFIDLADHYAGFDTSITVYNFLQYGERQWRLFNSSLHYQNRLRVNDYRLLHAESGWQVVAEQNTRRPAEQLRSITLDRQFAGYGEQDLLVCKSLITSRLNSR